MLLNARDLAVPGRRWAGYTVLQLLHHSDRSLVLRCTRDDATAPVVVKIHRPAAAQPALAMARFRHEYALARRIEHPHVLRPTRRASFEGALYYEMPDDGALSLRELLRQGPLPLAAVLRVALAVVDALQAVHAQNVIHKDVSPGNVIAALDHGVVRLIDFGIAAELSSERPVLARPDALEGTLATLAPEQSGRMNRDVDYRADFYALGATLYECIAGRPPFAFDDPVAAVHAHLTLAPPALATWRPQVPALLDALIARLLAKAPEARYQSHQALRRDLQHLLAHLDQPAQLAAHRLARDDLPHQLQLSGRLYGRDAEVARVLHCVQAAAQGPARLLAIAGQPGIGKTAMVHEVQRALLGLRGQFVSGKFNQYGGHAPCAPFFEALQQRGRQILALPDADRARWRTALAAALADNAAVVTEAVPDLARLLGPVPALLPLGPAEAENRFVRSVLLCCAALASADEPLVLFIDDLQWSDRASRRLLREMVQDEGLRHLLLIGAYRSTEVPADHPLAQDLASYAGLGEDKALLLEVGPLALADTCQWLADTLYCPPAEVQALAVLCQAKTGGNPFFLRRFVEDLGQRRLLWLDRDAARWRWSLDAIATERLAENVATLMAGQLQRLPGPTRALLSVAACLGGRFELHTLATASAVADDVAMAQLAPALQAGLLAPADGHYKWVGALPPEHRADLQVALDFAHDRVQEAAYALTAPPDRPALHLRIGRLLRPRIDTERPAFDVVDHLNRGAALLDDADERADLAALNLRASHLARDAAAFDLAASHADQALALAPAAAWERAHGAQLALHVHAGRMAALAGRPERMDACLDAALPRARNAAERAQLLDVRIESLYAAGQLAGTLDLGLAALRALGAELPAAASLQDVAALVAALRAEIEAIGVDALAERATMHDAEALLQLAIVAKMTAAAYIGRPALLPLLTVLQVRLMVARGHAPAALSAYSVLGLMVAEFLGDYPFGYRLGRMSMDLIERHGWRQVQAHAGFSFNAFLRHWIEPIRTGLPALREVAENGQTFGNLRHAGLALYLHGCHALLAGEPLAALAPVLQSHAEVLRRIRQPVALDYVRVLQRAVAALRRTVLADPPLDGDGFSTAALDATYAARGDQTGAMFRHAFACMLLALSGQDARAEAEGQAAAQLFSAGRGMLIVPFCLFFTASAALRLARAAPELAEQRRANAGAALAQLQRSTAHNPELAPLALLLQALLAPEDEAEAAHARALAAAGQHLLLQGLALQGRAGWRQQRAPREAAADAAEARAAFLRWGAVALAGSAPATIVATSQGPNAALDLASLMKSVEAITTETALAPLLARLLHLLRENAGAQRAAIVLGSAGRWQVAADTGAAARLGALEDCDASLPLPLLRTVLNSAEPVLVDDLRHAPAWQALPYFARHGGRSVLGLPLLRQGQVVGALYLENEAAGGAFSSERTAFLRLLSGNVVVALDNAQLVERLRELNATLEQRVAERTRALRESEERMLALLGNAPVPMTVTRAADGILVYANAPAAAVMGVTPQELAGQPAALLYRDVRDRERLYAQYRRDGVVRDFEVLLRTRDDQDRWGLVTLVPMVYDGAPSVMATVIDISARKRMEEELRRLATTDALTGVANRGHFMERAAAELQRARRYGRPLAVVMLDIDHFKQINDQHGHSAGDEAIRQATAVCRAMVRQQDLVGRLGGEEFGILLPETGLEAALHLAQRLCERIAAVQVPLAAHCALHMTASFGVAQWQDGDGADELLGHADRALYAAKHAGRNRVHTG
jgi:diguanylate cyclase (GGDEF)-like protein/PAS domain S-box-containing protein